MLHTILISPPLPEPPPNDFGPPYEMAMAAACLQRAGCEPACHDWSRNPELALTHELMTLVGAEQPRCLGLFFGAEQRLAVWAALRSLRRCFPELFIVLDGELPHTRAELVLKRSGADAVMPRESELVWPELINALSQGADPAQVPGLVIRDPEGVRHGPPRPPPADLDALPDPAYHLIQRRASGGGASPELFIASHHCSSMRQAMVVYSSRGCRFRCCYCPESLTPTAIRSMSPERFVEQIAHLHRDCGARSFVFADSLFTHDRARVEQICAALRERELGILWSIMTRPDCVDRALLVSMASAGCVEVAYGVESGSPAVQRALRKQVRLDDLEQTFRDTRAANIAAVLLLMVGNPGDSPRTIRETLVAVRNLHPDRVLINTTKLEPGTASFDEAERRGIIDPTWYFDGPVFPPPNTLELSEAEIADLHAMIQPRRAHVDLASLEDVQSGLHHATRRAATVVLGRTDPLMRADFPDLLRIAREARLPRLTLYTDAQALHPPRRVETIRAWGAHAIRVPFFSVEAGQHDAVTTSGSFERSVRGAANWRVAGGSVSLQIGIGVWARAEPEPLFELVERSGAGEVCFFFHESPDGWQHMPMEELPQLSSVVPSLRRAMTRLRARGVRVALSGIPACIAGEELPGSDDVARPFDELHTGREVRALRHIRQQRKVYGDACRRCPQADLCEGVWASYRDRFGDDELGDEPAAQSESAGPWLRTDRAGLRRALDRLEAHPPGNLLASQRVDELCIMQSFACSLRCDYCWLWGKTGLAWDEAMRSSYREQLPIGCITQLIDDLLAYRVRQINLSGGEPLSGKTWHPIAAHARSLGLPVALTTSGVLLERHAEAVCEVFDQVNVSINGPPSIADKVRPGPSGHYDAMIRGMRQICEHKRQSGTRTPQLRVLSTISDTNYAHLAELIEYLRSQEIDVDQLYFQFLIFNDTGTLERQRAIHHHEFDASLCTLNAYTYTPRDIDFELLWSQISAVERAFPHVQFSAPLDRQSLERYYTGQKDGIVPSYCAACWTELELMPNGDLTTCPDIPLGNILHDSFSDIWNGAVARNLRGRVMEELFPMCSGCFHYWGDRGARERRATTAHDGARTRKVVG